MKFSVCVDAVYMGKDFYQGMEEVKECGLNHIEFWTWWDKDIEKLYAETKRLGIQVEAFCTKFISLVDADQRSNYIKGLEETIGVAKKLGCKTIISQTGNDNGKPREEQRASLISGLRECVPLLKAHGLMLVIEPLNLRVDHAGYYLAESEEGFGIIEEAGSEHVKLLFDIYHQQITEGDVTRRMLQNIDKIGHIHAAGNPGRHEIACSELNYDFILKEIDATPYTGAIGLEYFPVMDIKAEFKRLDSLQKESTIL